MSGIRVLLSAAVLSLSPLLGQIASTDVLYFSTRFTETPQSLRGGNINGTQPSTCNPFPTFGGGVVIESVITNSPGFNYVTPGVPNQWVPSVTPPTMITDFVEVANIPQFNAIIGDLDGDGVPAGSSNFGGIDALYVPSAIPGRPTNLHEVFVSSWSDSTGSQGFIGTNITEADVVMLPAAGNAYPTPPTGEAPIFFLRQTDLEIFFGLGTTNAIDTNGFTVDPATGDLYISFDSGSTSSSLCFANALMITSPGGAASALSVEAGDVFRIPATAFTPSGPYGIVTAPQSGLVERVLSASEVATLVGNAGGTLSFPSFANTYGLDMDPQGGTALTAGGFTIPNLLFTVENRGGSSGGGQNATASAVYSTFAIGTFAILNGVQLDQPNAVGINDLSFNPGYYAGPLDAIDVITHTPGFDPVFEKPLHIDGYPDSGLGSSSPQTLTGYVSGSTPGAILALFGRVDVIPAGGFVPRYGLGGVVNGWPDLYVDPYGLADSACVIAPTLFAPFSQYPTIQSVFNGGLNPITTYIDPNNGTDNGDSCFQINFPAIPAAVPPLVLTVQVFDLSNLRISDPWSFIFN